MYHNFYIQYFMNLHISAQSLGFLEPKHVAEICKFVKYLIKNRVRLYIITLFN